MINIKRDIFMNKIHHYPIVLQWTGNTGSGTSSYRSYERSYEIKIANKSILLGSSDPTFRGDSSRHNPEELFVASISSCHMLWYLHLCADAGIVVTSYEDQAIGTMKEQENGSGQFEVVSLQISVSIQEEKMRAQAKALHQKANEMCFIANSCNFPITHQVKIMVET